MSIHTSIKNEHNFAKKHLESKLLTRLKIFIVMYLALLGYIVYDVAGHMFNPILIIGAFLAGIIVGYAAGRMFTIQWHVETSKVVARLDILGTVILVLYIAFSAARTWIFGQWLVDPVLTAVSLTFATGAILGRILMMNTGIRKVLSKQGILPTR